MVKVYTRKGDKGVTCLYSGQRVEKSDPIIHAVGSLDELSSHIGLLHCMTGHCLSHYSYNPDFRDIQRKLLDIGASVATRRINKNQDFDQENTKKLEEEIDDMTKVLPPLKNFLLQGSNENNARAHICRTICRRAERYLVEIKPPIDPNILSYINRLSDYFFTLARIYTSVDSFSEEIPYKK